MVLGHALRVITRDVGVMFLHQLAVRGLDDFDVRARVHL